MAKATVSAPDPPAESEEESGKEETSSEEEVNAAVSETESEPESKQTDNAQSFKKPPSATVPDAKNPEPQTSDSSSEEEGEGEGEGEGEEEDEEEEESEAESESDPTIKPIVSKPLDGDAQKASALKKPKSKPKNASLSSTSKKPNHAAGDKRPATSETGGDGEVTERKRSKKEIEESAKKSSSNKKSRKYFQRLWSEEDEIAILEGMADFSANKKADPFTNLDVFHQFIKNSLHVDVRKTQLQDKIRKMRKKYLDNADNDKQGQGKIFINDHERKAFELSKKVWGNETFSATGRKTASPKINGDPVKRRASKNVKSKKAVTDVGEEGAKGEHNLDGSSQGLERLKSVNWGAQKLGTEEWIMQNSIQLVDRQSRAEMDIKWRRFQMEEAELHCKRVELLLEEAKLLVDALRSSRD